MIRTLRKLLSWQPFTVRGAIVALLSLLGLKFYGVAQMDLVVFTIAGPLLALCCVLAVTTLFHGIRLKRKIVEKAHFDTLKLHSRSEISCGITVSDSSIFPFYSLTAERVFEQKDLDAGVFVLKGRQLKRFLVDSVRFPHRGLWQLEGIRYTLYDSLRLTSYSWFKESAQTIEVMPPKASIQPLPVLASSSRSGDMENLPTERTGDYFDFKQYDPSDGISRILWKTYARTGELYVRRPEPAVVPEGEVAIYLVAGTEEDHVASAALSYIEFLFKQDIGVLFGTDGSEDKSEHESAVSSSLDEIKQAIAVGANSAAAGSAEDFSSFISELENENRNLKQVFVFAPKQLASDSKNAEKASIISPEVSKHISLGVQGLAIEVCFALVPENLIAQYQALQPKSFRLRDIDFSYGNLKRLISGKQRKQLPKATSIDATIYEVMPDEGGARA